VDGFEKEFRVNAISLDEMANLLREKVTKKEKTAEHRIEEKEQLSEEKL
jgi:hypothetical protein